MALTLALLLQTALPNAVVATHLPTRSCHVVEPAEAIRQAARWYPKQGPSGCYRIIVRRVDFNDGDLFLDSEQDYRLPSSLNVKVNKRTVSRLKALLQSEDLPSVLTGQTLLVTGTATRVPIAKLHNGGVDVAYYQTQVNVIGLGQLAIPAAIDASTITPTASSPSSTAHAPTP